MHRTLLVLFASLAPLGAQATIAHSEFDGPGYANGVSMGGPNLLVAFRTTIPASFVATRVDVFTGEGNGTNTIAIWSHDAVNNRPLASLGTGTWQMGNVNTWQGAFLPAPVPLTTGQDVWIVWGPVNNSQASVAGTGAGAQPQRGSFDGGLTWNGPFQSNQWKFRIWSGSAPHYEVFGTGCAGSNGTPRLGWDGLPLAGQSFDVVLERAPANGVAGLILGDSDTTWSGSPLPLSLGFLGAPSCSLLASVTVSVTAVADGAGRASVTIPIPVSPTLAGFAFFDQWFVLDLAANPFGFSFSNGGRAIVGA